MTNGDVIRNMSDEKLACFALTGFCPYILRDDRPCKKNCYSCDDCRFNWLKQEAPDAGTFLP